MVRQEASQHSVHLTGGYVPRFQAVFLAQTSSAKTAYPHPTRQQVTLTVGAGSEFIVEGNYMKESDKQNGSKIKLKYIVVAIIFIGFISVTTSYFTVKTLVSTPPAFTSTPIEIINTSTPTILPLSTLDISSTVTGTPTQQYIPIVESNLIQNGDFENGLEGWTIGNQKELFIYETTGVSGKGICSRRYIPNVWSMPKVFPDELLSLSQEVNINTLIDTYFLSAWVKLNTAINIYIKIYYVGSQLANPDYGGVEITTYSQSNRQNNGITTNGWFFRHIIVSIKPRIISKVAISFYQGAIKDPPQNIDSTFCVDDVMFGEVVK